LEDETTISNNFIELVNKLRGRDNDIIYLGCKDDTCKFTDSLHGYIVSKNGAKKMVELHNTNKIPFLLNYIDRNLDIYRGPELVFKNVDMMRLKKESVHPLITFFTGSLGLSNTTLLNFNSDILYFRKFDYGITYLSIYLLLPSLIAGLLGQKISLCYLITLIIAFIAELIIWNRQMIIKK